MLNKNFWKGKKVFLTGHTGFKGSWMVSLLKLLDAEVCGYSIDIPTKPSMFEQIHGHELVDKHIFGDILNFDQLKNAYEAFAPEIVIHMAAQPLVSEGYANPVLTFQANAIGTANVLEAIRVSKHKPQSCLIVTTDKCYENNETAKSFVEEDSLGGSDPYSASKACAEIVTKAYYSSFLKQQEVKVLTGRAGNVIGGGDWALNRIVPDIVRAIQTQTTLQLRNPDAIRPWQHVIEPVVAYLRLIETDLEIDNFSFNFGPGPESEKPVRTIVEFIDHNWGAPLKASMPDKVEFKEAKFLKLDISKANKYLGWKPRLNLEETLRWTIDWYKTPDTQIYEVTLKQIKEYLSL